jgi:glycosidase
MDGKFHHITARIPEIARLGVTALWIQPVYATHYGGQGYDVIDYFRVRPELGSEQDLRTLISVAHGHGLRVLLDFVPNHTSIQHPYARDASLRGRASHYYDFYQRVADAAPYAQHYHSYQGFINYFWNELPNLNYDHPEVRRMITEAGKYWVEKYDIDGYRIDAVWGVNARRPEFMQEWRLALKRIKPDLLLLGEDKATWSSVFDRRFDAAYDWGPEESWVSHWSWQTDYSTSSNPTIFNHASSGQRSALLRSSLTNSGNGFARGAKVFRFMEDNDTFRFLPTHDLARTKMAAALLFTLPGIPLVFNGQELGAREHPYSALMIVKTAAPIPDQDPYGLFPHYARLARLRTGNAALLSDSWAEVPVTPGAAVFAFRRWGGGQEMVVVVNMASSPINARVSLPADSMVLRKDRLQYLSDLLTGEVQAVPYESLDSLVIAMPAYTTRILLLDTAAVTGVDRDIPSTLPRELALSQNYPNPFNPWTTIAVDLPERQPVRLAVYDVVGREVAVLISAVLDGGRHLIRWNAEGAASGVYFCRLEAGGRALLRKMVLIR